MEFRTTWLVLSIVLGVAFVGLGIWLVGRPSGILIDERRKMSLSRLQLVLWTWLLVSAAFAAAIACRTSNVKLSPELYALMGIIVGSAAGSVIVNGNKQNQEPTPAALAAARQAAVDRAAPPAATNATGQPATANVAAAQPGQANRPNQALQLVAAIDNRRGVLPANDDVKKATFRDLFAGEELINQGLVDMAKVQMFFFTIAAIGTYAWTLYNTSMPEAPADVVTFPVLSDSLVTLLGISHAGYLTIKAAPKTPTAT